MRNPSKDGQHEGRFKDKRKAILQILPEETEVSAAAYFCVEEEVLFNLYILIYQLSFRSLQTKILAA